MPMQFEYDPKGDIFTYYIISFGALILTPGIREKRFLYIVWMQCSPTHFIFGTLKNIANVSLHQKSSALVLRRRTFYLKKYLKNNITYRL